MKSLSCGFIVIDSNTRGVLACHPCGSRESGNFAWDIPKGHREEGEEPIDAARRELREETGIVLPGDADIYEIGHVGYQTTKALHLFSVTYPVDPGALKCESLVEGNGRPEIDRYMLTKCCDRFFVSMRGHVARELQRRYGAWLVKVPAEGGQETVDCVLTGPRRDALLDRLAIAKDSGMWYPEGTFSYADEGRELTFNIGDVGRAVVEASRIVTVGWSYLWDRRRPYEAFPFSDFVEEVLGD